MFIDTPLVHLGQWLRQTGYRFVTVTPATHARVNARVDAREARSIEDVFGWSRPFRPSVLPAIALHLLEEAGALERRGDLFSSSVRYSVLDDQIYVHSAFPTLTPDSVFFGPDTYRFAALIQRTIDTEPVIARACIVDVGCGAGAGGIVAARAAGGLSTLIMTDINPAALRHAEINATLAGVEASFRQGDLFAAIEDPIDLIVANPPYLVDPEARLYRHGGGELGSGLSMRIVREGLSALAPGGTLILYTGSCIVKGRDPLCEAIALATRGAAVSYAYTELDPDVFGEELELPANAEVDRIAVVSAVFRSLQTPSAAGSTPSRAGMTRHSV
jgi:methylase of polypeptide subunit release factors